MTVAHVYIYISGNDGGDALFVQFMKKKGILSGATLTVILLGLTVLTGCCTCPLDLEDIDYAPVVREDWEVSTPEDQNLDPLLVAEMYCKAQRMDKIFSLLVVKNGKLIAEGYFNDGAIDQKDLLQSVTKSINSACMGKAIDLGLVSGVNAKMLDFFPDIADEISDPRKKEITVRQMLQMRAGFPWEESAEYYWDAMLSGYYIPLIESFPLVYDPGNGFYYSNLTADWLGIIVDRQSGMNLKAFAQHYIFDPLGIVAGDWRTDADGHNNGAGDLHLSARDAAKFGLMYLNDGVWEGERILPAQWVEDSHRIYTEDAWKIRVGSNFKEIGYGYQWWSVTAGNYQYNLAWGHGGQQIALVHDLDMVIVVTSYPFWLEHDDSSWRHEKASLNLVADFVASLPPK